MYAYACLCMPMYAYVCHYTKPHSIQNAHHTHTQKIRHYTQISRKNQNKTHSLIADDPHSCVEGPAEFSKNTRASPNRVTANMHLYPGGILRVESWDLMAGSFCLRTTMSLLLCLCVFCVFVCALYVRFEG